MATPRDAAPARGAVLNPVLVGEDAGQDRDPRRINSGLGPTRR